MRTYSFKGKTYRVDTENFLIDKDAWDKGFAEGIAVELGIKDGLGQRHWEVIDFIRNRFRETGGCPVVHETTRALGMNLKELQALFPTGWLSFFSDHSADIMVVSALPLENPLLGCVDPVN